MSYRDKALAALVVPTDYRSHRALVYVVGDEWTLVSVVEQVLYHVMRRDNGWWWGEGGVGDFGESGEQLTERMDHDLMEALEKAHKHLVEAILVDS